MATPLGTTSFTDEEVVAQSDVNLAGTTVEILIIEFDQAKYEDLFSFGSLSPKAMCKIRKASKKTKAPSMPDSPKECPPWGLNCSHSPLFEGERPQRRPQFRVSQSSNQRDPELRVSTTERQPRVKRSPQGRVPKAKRESQDRVLKPKRSPQRRVPKTKRESQDSVLKPKRSPQRRVPKPKRSPQGRVPISKRRSQDCVSQIERSPQWCVIQIKRSLKGCVSQLKRKFQHRVSQTERRLQRCVSRTKRSPQRCVSQIEHGPQVRVVQMEHDPRVFGAMCQVEFKLNSASKMSMNSWHLNKIQTQQELISSNHKLGVPIQTSQEVSNSSQVFATDLREFLSGERPIQQIVHSCHCERLISTVPSRCQCCSCTAISSVFNPPINVASEDEYLGVTSNMIGRGGLSIPSSDEPEANRSPGLKEVLNDPDGVYRHTRTRTGVISPVNYQRLAKGLKPDDEHSAIADSQSSSSFMEHESAVYTTESIEDLKKRLEEYQAEMQENMRLQQEALRSQQESIDQIRDMMAQIIADRAQFQMSGPIPQPESSRRRGRSSKRKEKMSEASDQEAHHAESSFEEEKRTENEQDPQSAKMRELEARLNAMANRCELQDQGVVRPYPAEWDTVPYPSKFKIPTLQAFDGTGSPNQHIYHFKSQTGNAMSNDAILSRLFIGTLKGVAFEWFMKLPTGCIRKWADLERLFLSRFFEDDTEISVTSLLAIKQKEGEPIKAFVERFRSMALRCSTGMTQSALIDTCRHNLQTNLLARMGVVKCHSWKQLVFQGEQAEIIVARVEAEEEENNSEDLAIDDPALNREADSE